MKVAPKTNEMNELCIEELWHFLKSAKNIFITYSEAEGEKPSYELKKLIRVNGVLAYSYADYDEAVKAERKGENLARYAGSVSGASEMALTLDGAPYQASLKEAVGEENLPKERKIEPFLEEAKEIFLKSKATSVSALQTYFDCPFKYFISYALSVKKAKDGKVEPVDIGLLLHKIVEKFVESGMPDDVAKFVEKAAPLALDEFEKYRYKTNEDIFLRLKGEAVKLCTIVAEQVKAGSFKPIATECSFGKSDSTLETITYPSGVRLMGEIDRIDEFERYARVIDYKTGRSKFDYNDLYFGRKIQLMIYMQVLRKNGYLPAGVFYFPSAFSWGDDEFSHRLCGPFNTENDLLTAFDRALEDEAKSSVIEIATKRKKNGELSFRSSKLTCTQAELEKMCDYAEKVAGEAIEEIARGVVDPSPASSDRASACDYCDYYSICGGAKGKERYTSGVDKAQIVGDDE
jgi:ATP-dependent helicase/DNAse subunit B